LGNAEEIVGEHGGADEQLEALSALGQTAFHAPSPEQHRDAAFDAGAEALAFFESWTFLDGFSFGSFLSAPLRDGDKLDAGLLAGSEIVGAIEAAVGAIKFGGLAKGFLMVQERGSTWCSSAGFPSSTRQVVANARRVLQQTQNAHGQTLLDDLAIQALRQEIQHYCQLGDRVIDQARRRVLEGEEVPSDQKIYSIFEPHTDLIKRGKTQKPIEFG
jgi:hypothetical protein